MTNDDRPTITVRIACVVVVDELGIPSYNAIGYQTDRGVKMSDDQHEAFRDVVDVLPVGSEYRCWIECEVPLPEPPTTLEGKATDAE